MKTRSSIKCPFTTKVTSAKLVMLLSAFTSVSTADVIQWGGGDGEYTTPANWVGGVLPDTANGDTAQINGGDVIYTPGGDLPINNGGLLQINGGSWTQVDGFAWIQMGGGSLEVNGGIFNQGTAGDIVRNASSSISVSAGTANLNGNLVYNPSSSGALSISGSGLLSIANEFHPIADFTMTGGTLEVGNVIAFVHGPGRIDLSGGNIVLDGSGAFSGFYAPDATSYLNFTPGSVGSLRFNNYTADELDTDAFLSNGTIQFGGTIDPSAFTITESGGGVNVNVIPEPGTLALSLVAIGTLFWFRRRS